MANQTDEASTKDSQSYRIVSLGITKNENFCSNQVVTARYSVWTWIPKSIFMQFTRINNIYWLILVILSYGSFSPKGPVPLTVTFGIVIIFTTIKDGVEDIWRHKQDKQVNLAKFERFNPGTKDFEVVTSESLKVGDVVKIKENEDVPADCIMLSNSNPKGVAYVNTMNLDGETSLKEKLKSNSTEKIKSKQDLAAFFANFFVDKPNRSLVNWNANIFFDGITLPLNQKQLLLRGSVLKNTDWVYGIIIYSGNECKISLNSKPAKTKISYIQKVANKIVITIIIFLFSVCLLYGGFGKKWFDSHYDSDIYIPLPSSYNGVEVITRAVTYWIQFFIIVPIAFYVFIEILRLVLCSFILNDLEMFNQNIAKGATWRCSDIVEELGRVQFIFSDKTGTLTKNEMELIKFNISGIDYLIRDQNSIINLEAKISEKNESVLQYFTLVLLCNTVFPAFHEGKKLYQSISPDDIALIEGSRYLGFDIEERGDNSITLNIRGRLENWVISAEIPFSSARKKMTVVVKSPDGEYYVFTKGADSAVLPMTQPEQNTENIILNYAKEGLRTLVMAGRKLPNKKVQKWLPKYNSLMLSNSPTKDEELDSLAESIEKKLKLFGISAVEDKLQDSVPETIELLLQANIRIWMITGDKEETALEIAKNCRLLSKSSDLHELFEPDRTKLVESIQEIANLYKVNDLTFDQLESVRLSNKISLAINGITVSYILENEDLAITFFKLAYISETCICCRMSPLQKSEIVKLSKKLGLWTTLAIGDGANDVAMIQEAHVGVGIFGKEGTQASLAAEYTLTQFSHLAKLLLVHGRYAYLRVTVFVNFYYYKNFVAELCEAWFGLYTGFSGQIFYVDWLISLYTVIWTSWQCLLFFVTEQDISPENSLKYPNLYSAGQKNYEYGVLVFWRWMFFAFSSATFCFWVPVGSLANGVGGQGHEPSLFWISTTCFILLFHLVNLKLVFISRHWNKVTMFILFLGFLVCYVMILILNAVMVAQALQPEFPKLFIMVLSHGKTWILIILGSFIGLLPDFLYEFTRLVYFPTPTDKVISFLSRSGKINYECVH